MTIVIFTVFTFARGIIPRELALRLPRSSLLALPLSPAPLAPRPARRSVKKYKRLKSGDQKCQGRNTAPNKRRRRRRHEQRIELRAGNIICPVGVHSQPPTTTVVMTASDDCKKIFSS